MMRSTPVIFAVVGDDADVGTRLAEAINPPFTLFMTGGIPGQVVMDDGVEVALQVDAFTETIGRDEHALRELGDFADSVLTFGRRELAGNTDDLGAFWDLSLSRNALATYSAVWTKRQKTIG